MELLKHGVVESDDSANKSVIVFNMENNAITTVFDYETQSLDAARFAREKKDKILSFYVGATGNYLRTDMGVISGTRWIGWAQHGREEYTEIDEITLFDAIQAIPEGVTEAFIYKAKEW